MKILTQLPILYSFRRCPYAMRARLAIAVSGIKVELREVVLRDKPPQMLEVSPKATVPVLVEPDGSIIDESMDIMLWALEQNDPEGWLAPDDNARQQVMSLIVQCDNDFKPRLDRYKYANRYEDVDAQIERDQAAKFLWQLDERLRVKPNLFGNNIMIADMAIVTFVRQFANVDRDWFDTREWKYLRNWLVTFQESERFAAIMNKYEKWEEGGELVVF